MLGFSDHLMHNGTVMTYINEITYINDNITKNQSYKLFLTNSEPSEFLDCSEVIKTPEHGANER